MAHRLSGQHGFVLLPVVLLISLVATAAFMLNHESALEGNMTASASESAQARNVAEAGLQHTLAQITQAGCGPYTDISSEPFGNHNYSSTITTNNVGGTITTYTVAVSDDAFIREDQPTSNYGSDAKLEVYQKWFASEARRALYRFDIAASGIPAGALVVSAVAKVFVVTPDPFTSVRVHQVTADWTEGAVTWGNIASAHDSISIASIGTNPPAGQYVAVNITSLVQGWINGSVANQGIMLKPSLFNNDILSEYTSKEYSTASQRPYLEIQITDGSLANRATISATGTLVDGVNRTISRNDVVLYQAPPGVLPLQPDAVEGKDAEIWDQAPNNNYGDVAETWVSSASNDTTRSLLRFNMGAIPAGARILGATLSLDRQSGSGSDQPVSAHRIMNPWSEDSVSWNSRETGTNWDTAGADFDSMAVATTLVGPVNQRYEWNITPLVQGWVDGSYPNDGVALVAAIAGMPGERFYTSNHTDPSRWPSLSITYTCECGTVCLAPQGSGNILLVVGDAVTLDPGDIKKKALFEAWGYSINLIDDDADQATFNTALSNNDVAYISETVWGTTLAGRLANTDKGVVNEDEDQNSRLGLSGSGANTVGESMAVIDNSHYITALFPNGVLPIFTAPMEGMLVTGTPAPGLQTLGSFSGTASLALVEQGGVLGGSKIGENAAGRRVAIPIGSNNKFNWNYLNNNGRLIVQRAIQWGTGNTGGLVPPKLLMVVVDPGNLTASEIGKKTQVESWGYMVSLIDESDNQGAFDTALANNDVVYISEETMSTEVGSKLTAAAIGVVTEEANLSDEFGLSDGIQWQSGTTLVIVKNSHYITEPFSLGSLTVLNTSQAVVDLTGTLAPDLQVLGNSVLGPALVAVPAGASIIGGTAAGRRVLLPWGDDNFVINRLTADGLTLFERALAWAAGAGDDGTGPVAHWKLDDASGNIAVDSEGGHDGTLANGPAWTTGQDGGALDLDGSNDYIDVPHNDALSLTETLTFTAWINPDVIGGSYNTVLAKDEGGSNSNFWFGLFQDELDFGFFSGGSFREVFTSGLNVQAGTWQYVAVSFDNNADEVRFYLNGMVVDTQTFSFSPTAVSANLTIGRSPDGEYWRGLLDDVRIYDTVLSEADIAMIHSATGGGGGGGGGGGDGGGGGGDRQGGCNGIYLDNFNNRSWDGSNGTIDWTSPWVEVGEFDGPTSGDIQMRQDTSKYQLRTRDNDNGGEGVEREADLSGAGSATLSYVYLRVSLDKASDYTAVEISADGVSGPWEELVRHQGPAEDGGYISVQHDISKWISANTRIRFKTSSNMGGSDVVWFDNIQIECSP